MDIIKYINDKNYFNCDYKKIEQGIKENIEKDIKEIKRSSFIQIKKTKFAILTSLYTLVILLIALASFTLTNTKFGQTADIPYNCKKIEYYRYFDMVVGYGPRVKSTGEIDMLYKLDFLSEEDKTILKEYEEEVISKKNVDCVAFSICLGIKDGKDQIYLVCYPAKNMSSNWYPFLYYDEKKVFIFDSNCKFKFEKVLQICKNYMIKKGIEEKKVEEILKDYDGDYSYRGLRIEILYSTNEKLTRDREKNKEIKKNADVIYDFYFDFFTEGDRNDLRNLKQINISEEQLISK